MNVKTCSLSWLRRTTRPCTVKWRQWKCLKIICDCHSSVDFWHLIYHYVDLILVSGDNCVPISLVSSCAYFTIVSLIIKLKMVNYAFRIASSLRSNSSFSLKSSSVFLSFLSNLFSSVCINGPHMTSITWHNDFVKTIRNNNFLIIWRLIFT